MPCIRRSAVSLAVSATLALGLCPTALAQPVPRSAPPATTQAEQPPDGWDIDTLSKGRKAEIALARRMATHAVNWKKRTWNYALADKYDKGKAATRRKAAAGWLVGGGKVTHISKSELEKVRVYQRRLAAPPSPALQALAAPRCTGRHDWKVTALVVPGVTTFWASQIWLNSCDVVLIGDGLDYAAGVFTILAVGFAAEVPPLGAVMGAAAGVLLIEKTYLLAVARKSDVLAVKLSQNFAGWTTLKPQPA